MSSIVPLDPEGGNTNPPPKQISPAKMWCFTWNNYDSSKVPEFRDLLHKEGKYIFQAEVGESGTAHLQGYIEFNEKCRPLSRIKIKEIHWEKAKGTKRENQKYCSKLNTKAGPVYSNMDIIGCKDPMEGKTWKKWQLKIKEFVETKDTDDRKIYWFWEPDGKVGKTTLCKHLCIKHNALLLSGKANDVKYGVQKWVENENPTNLFIFHYTRTNEDWVSYEALEAIKDGIFFSGKYESGMVMYDSPKVIVFANFEPKLDAMSKDRWEVHKIPP
jgi:hypothetical protein